MANVAESLLILLQLDTKGVKKGAQETEDNLKKVEKQSNKTGQEIEKAGKMGAMSIGKVTTAITGLVAAVGAARLVKDFFDNAVTGMAKLGRSAEYVRMSAKELDAWGGALESVGGTAAEAQQNIGSFYQKIFAFGKTGESSPLIGVLNTLGVNVRQFAGTADPAGNMLKAFADKLHQMTPEMALLQGRMAGLSDNFINLLRKGGPEVGKLVSEFERFSAASDENVKNAERVQAAWAKMERRFEGIKVTLEAKLLPIFERLLDRFSKWLDTVDWGKVSRQIDSFIDAVLRGVDALGGWKNILIGLGAIMTLNLLSPLTGIVGMLGRMIPLLASSQAGVLALAAAGGALAGTAVWKLIEGTQAGDIAGQAVTSVMAALGDTDAKAALERDFFSKASAKDQGQLKAGYLMMNAKQKAAYEAEHPGLSSSIKASLASQRASELAADTRYYASHSAIYGDPAKLFASLEAHEGLPKGILNAMFKQESASGTRLQSSAGAKGPFQFMEGTAAQFGLSGNDVFDLDKSGAAAARYLKQLMSQFGGDTSKALAAYNWGPGNVAKYGLSGAPAETRGYLASILPQIGTTSTATTSIDNTKRNEISIGTVQVHTQATSANDIASSIPGALQRNMLVGQALQGQM